MNPVHCSAVTNTHLLTHTTQAPKEASGCLGSIDGQRIAQRRSETSARQAAVHSTSRVSNTPCLPVPPHRAVGGLTSCVVARQVKRTRRALETAQSAQSVANKASSERDRRRLGEADDRLHPPQVTHHSVHQCEMPIPGQRASTPSWKPCAENYKSRTPPSRYCYVSCTCEHAGVGM